LLEWLQASRLPSREEYGNWSEGGYNLYNAGDVEIPFEIFFELSSTSPLTVTVQKGERKVTLTAVNAKIKNTEIDKFIGINSRDYVVRGYNADLKYTGNTYNEYITDGDFFLLEVGHNDLTTTVAPATVKMHYLYL
jgi:phage-related protein